MEISPWNLLVQISKGDRKALKVCLENDSTQQKYLWMKQCPFTKKQNGKMVQTSKQCNFPDFSPGMSF